MDEREFYEQILDIIKEMNGISLTPQNYEQLKEALEEIGCMRYDEWKAQKGQTVSDNSFRNGIEQASISTAVSLISQLLYDYSNASYSLQYMLEGGEEHGSVQKWLRNSRELYPKAKEEKEEELDER